MHALSLTTPNTEIETQEELLKGPEGLTDCAFLQNNNGQVCQLNLCLTLEFTLAEAHQVFLSECTCPQCNLRSQ